MKLGSRSSGIGSNNAIPPSDASEENTSGASSTSRISSKRVIDQYGPKSALAAVVDRGFARRRSK